MTAAESQRPYLGLKVRKPVNTLAYPSETECALGGGAIPASSFTMSSEDRLSVLGLRNRDEASFLELVQRYHGSLVRIAQSFVNSRAIAEEVAQETWLGVLQGIDRFEGRCSLKTWIFQILINRAKTRGVREARSVSFSALGRAKSDVSDFAVDPSCFLVSDDLKQPDGWASQPQQWNMTPEQLLLSHECRSYIEHAITNLPDLQKQVITLRDVQGWNNAEISALLGISESNCRVLLHRARSRVRQALEDYLGTGNSCGSARPH